MSRSCEESLAIRCEKQARVSPTPNGGARGHSGENTPNKLNIGVADSRRSLSALRPQQKQKRDKPRYGILPVKPKFASAYPQAMAGSGLRPQRAIVPRGTVLQDLERMDRGPIVLLGLGVQTKHLQHVPQASPGATCQQKDLRVLALLLQQVLKLESGGRQQLQPDTFHLRDVGQVDVAHAAEHRFGCFVGVAVILHGECPL